MSEGLAPLWDVAGFPVGTRIAGYRLEEQIGRGGMAVVFRAYDERLNRQVALKLLAPALAADVAFRQRFTREWRAAAAVDDPNIIPVFEAGEASGVLFIAMRLVRGGDVRSLVAVDGPLPPGRVASIVSAVASALDAAHAAGLVHRDVKPANMLLETRPGRADHVYLSDFGVTKGSLSASGLTGEGEFVGTVDYAAPEQIQGRKVDGRTDQYALGCSAFELLCGEPPFSRSLGLATVYAHLSEPPPSLAARRPGLPAGTDGVFARVLAKSPADRYQTCQEFADGLRAALDGAPARAAHPPAWPVTDTAEPVTATAAPRPATAPAAPAPVTIPATAVPAAPASVAPASVAPASVAPASVAPASATAVSATAVSATAVSATAVSATPASATAVSAAPVPGTSPEPRPARRRSWLRSRPLVIGTAVSLAAVGAAAAVLLTRAPQTQAASYTFAPQRDGSGLVVVRRWVLSGSGGSLLTERVTASNTTGGAQQALFEEPVPAQIAASLEKVRFSPAAAKVLTADRAVEWQLRVPAHGTAVVGYQVTVAAAGATEARLAQWAKDLDALAAKLGRATATPSLRTLRMTRPRRSIKVGQTVRLALSGVLPDGKSAPQSVLSTAVWSVANPAVATVSASGEITGRGPGTTRVTAHAGSVSASAVVTVTSSPSPNPAPDSGASSSSSPSTPKPHPNPTPTLTPTPLARTDQRLG